MARRKPALTKDSIASIRANQASACSNLLTRLYKSAYGTLEDKDGNKISMDSNQVNAAKLVIQSVLPAQASTEIADVTEGQPMTKDDHEKAYKAAQQEILNSMDTETLKALIDSRESLLDS